MLHDNKLLCMCFDLRDAYMVIFRPIKVIKLQINDQLHYFKNPRLISQFRSMSNECVW